MELTRRKRKCLREIYEEIFAYLRPNSDWCFLVLLFVGAFLLYTCVNTMPSDTHFENVGRIRQLYPNDFSFIATENLKCALFQILAGTAPFGIGTVFHVFLSLKNLVGSLKYLHLHTAGWKILVGILPHGIPELCAMLFSILLSALYSKATVILLLGIFHPEGADLRAFFSEIRMILKGIVFVLVPLVLIAAWIEANVSACLVEILLR